MRTGLVAGMVRVLGLRAVADDQPATRTRTRVRTRRSARATLICFVLVTLALNGAALLVLDEIRPGVRDPEYGRRVARLRSRMAENPGRPVVLVIGSSRAAMGVRPAEWEAIRPPASDRADPLLFNMSLLGGGPLIELMVARRVFADGLRPAVVLFEYWPPYLYSEGNWAEPNRVAIDRLYPVDRAIIRDYFPEPEPAQRAMQRYRDNPIFAARHRLLVQVFPKWLPHDKRADWTWDEVDGWGWKPGFDFPPGQTPERAAMLSRCHDVYKPLFDNYRISPSADRAIREAVAVARAHGAAVGFTHLPESSEFRSWYPPVAERLAREHLATLSQELGVPVIDARTWMEDGFFVDGFHLSRIGASKFTRRLGPAVAGAFPELGGPR